MEPLLKATPGRPNDCTNFNFDLEQNVIDIVDPFKISPLAVVEDKNLCLDDSSKDILMDSLDDSELNEAIIESSNFDVEHSCERAPDIGRSNFKFV